MTSVVHVLDPHSAGDEGVLACAAALTIGAVRQRVVLFGDAATERAVWRSGIQTTQRISRSLVRVRAGNGSRALRRIIENGPCSTGDRPVVQCWCPRTLAAAYRAMRPWGARAGDLPLACAILRPFETVEHSNRAAQRRAAGSATLFCFDAAVRDAARGIRPDERWTSCQSVRLLDPPAPALPDRQDVARTEVRARLGIREHEPVISLLADPPDRGDALRFANVLGLAHGAGFHAVGLARSGVHQARRAARFLRSNAHRWEILFADCSLTDQILASDAAVCDTAGPEAGGGPTAGILAVRLAAAAGVPVVATTGVRLDGLLGPVAESLTGNSAEPPGLLHPLLRLFGDAAHRARIARSLAELTREPAAAVRESHTLADLWDELSDSPMSHGMPHLPTLAGARA